MHEQNSQKEFDKILNQTYKYAKKLARDFYFNILEIPLRSRAFTVSPCGRSQFGLRYSYNLLKFKLCPKTH